MRVNLPMNNIVTMNVDDLKPNEYNPNKYNDKAFELLCKSIREDGFTIPCVVRKVDNMIVDGEHRWKAAQICGYRCIPCVMVEMSDEQMKVATLRHNRVRGKEDVQLANAILSDLAELGTVYDVKDKLLLTDVEVEQLLLKMESAADVVDTEMREQFKKAENKSEFDISINEKVAGGQIEIFRFNFSFFDENAEIVRKVLGMNQAQRLLEMCRLES